MKICMCMSAVCTLECTIQVMEICKESLHQKVKNNENSAKLLGSKNKLMDTVLKLWHSFSPRCFIALVQRQIFLTFLSKEDSVCFMCNNF